MSENATRTVRPTLLDKARTLLALRRRHRGIPPVDDTLRGSGSLAEQQAEQFLRSKGLSTRQRNYRCAMGEIDLIMADGPYLVFVEVRFRRQNRYGTAAETVTAAKQRKLIRAAQHYLQKEGLSERVACRFDVVSIGQELQWFQNAFTL